MNAPGRRKVLFVCHSHSSVRPGGVETYVSELYEAMQTSGEFAPIVLARIAVPPTGPFTHPGTPFRPINGDPNQYFVENDDGFDHFYLTSRWKELHYRFLHEFLLALRPDVVHIQHVLYLGFDLLFQVRKTLPAVPIVYTLQEYIPICHNQGQMVRTRTRELCREASPDRCHECFPGIPAKAFFLRKRAIQAHLSAVDVFLAPSRFILERYVSWGIPREKIRFEEYGRCAKGAETRAEERRTRARLGYFGQLSEFKGVDVLFAAMRLLAASGSDAHLRIHGANLDVQTQEFQTFFERTVEAGPENVTFVGRYDQTELPRLMTNVDWIVVPSIWWENSPLVIQEAFAFGRPVICSDIGAMAEKVTDGVNGLHFRRGDPLSLADTIRRATTSPALWDTLRTGIPAGHTMDDHVATLTRTYQELLELKRS